MHVIQTRHASLRAQQRGIPQLVTGWLLDYGAEHYDGRGGVVRYFDSASIRHLLCEVGRNPLRRMSEFMRCYLVQSSTDGAVITIGKRYRNRRIVRH